MRDSHAEARSKKQSASVPTLARSIAYMSKSEGEDGERNATDCPSRKWINLEVEAFVTVNKVEPLSKRVHPFGITRRLSVTAVINPKEEPQSDVSLTEQDARHTMEWPGGMTADVCENNGTGVKERTAALETANGQETSAP